MSDEARPADMPPEPPLPPETLPGSAPVPTPFTDLPKPARKGDGVAAVPFDPMGYDVFHSLTEVIPKATRAEEVVTKGQIDAARRKATFIPKFATLESMYAANPELQRIGKLRIERIQPQWCESAYGGKTRVNGILSFRHDCIGSEEFARFFGGFKYRVFGLLDQENRENKGGPPQPVEIGVAEFDIPIEPNLNNLPIALADLSSSDVPSPVPFYGMPAFANPYERRASMSPPYPMYQGPMAMPSAPGLPVEPVLNFARDAMNQRNAPQPPISDAVWNVLGRSNEQATQVLRDSMQTQLERDHREREMLMRQLEEERRRNLELTNRPTDVAQMLDGVAKLTQAQKGTMDSDSMRQLREDYERQMAMLRQENERVISRLREEHDRALNQQRADFERMAAHDREANEIKARHQDDRIRDWERRYEQRETQLQQDGERRERLAREEFERVTQSREREYAARMAEMKELHKQQMDSMRDMYDREMRMRDTVQQNTVTTTGKAHEIEMRSIQTDLAKLSAELAEKKAIVEQHMAEKNKPLLEQVKEVQEMTAAIQEMAGGGDADDKEHERKWWDSPLVQEIAKVAIIKGSELLPKLGQAAQAAGAPGAGPAPQMGGYPNLPPAGRPPQALPPRKRQRAVFADADGPALRGYDGISARRVEGDMGQKRAMGRQFNPDAPPSIPTAPGGPGFGPPPMAATTPPAPAAPMPQPPADPAYMPPAATAPAAAAQPAAPAPSAVPDWSAFSWVPMEPAAVAPFIMQLHQAFTHKVPPQVLVEAFCQNYPMDVMQQVPAMIPIARLVETIRTSPATATGPLATGAGRRYLTDVWAEIARRVEQWKAQQSSPEPAPGAPASQPPATSSPSPAEPPDGQGEPA